MTATHFISRPFQLRSFPFHSRASLRDFADVAPLLIAACLLVGAGAVEIVMSSRSATLAPDAPRLPITVGGVAFNVPPAAMRVPVQRRTGAQERVDLAFLWPSLEGSSLAGNATAQELTTPAPERLLERVFVTIAVAVDKLEPAARIKTIYPRYVVADPEFLPSGIAVLAFRPGTPYQGEDLIYDSAAPDNFLVRCTRNGAGPTPGTCLYERRIEGADLIVRFPRDWLADWQPLASGIERLIASLRQSNG